jgi:hypothetical protein
MIAAIAPLAFAIAGLVALAVWINTVRLALRVWRALMESRPND